MRSSSLTRRRLLQAMGGAAILGLGSSTLGSPARAISASSAAAHPRIVATAASFAAVRQRVAADQVSAQMYQRLRQQAETILGQPVSKYEFPDGRTLLLITRQVLLRSYTLGLLYQIDGDVRYAQRLWAELEAAAVFPDWNPVSFLSTAEMTHAFALGYDWLYDYWTPAQRTVLSQAIANLGLTPGLAEYRRPTSWVNATHNWNIVCNAGLGMGALAIAEVEPAMADEVLQRGLDSIQTGIAEYGPDGGYPEGVGSYWDYATRYLVPYLASLNAALGNDSGLSETPGLAETGFFPIYLSGPFGQTFNYADAGTGILQTPEMLWLADKYQQPIYGWWGELGAVNRPSAQHLLWYNPTNTLDPITAKSPLDKYFRNSEVVTSRSAWENNNAVFTGFKAGDNKFNHGDLDLGDFVIDALGVRWASELGSDDYGLPGYWSTGTNGQRWTYYRKRAEGQNTLVLNPGTNADQDPLATGTIIRSESGVVDAFSVADLTNAYSGREITSWKRGVRMFDHRRQVLIQDEVSTSSAVGGWWFLHTRVSVKVAADGKSAVLSSGSRRLLARIVSPSEGVTFTVMDASPLWTSPLPAKQTANVGVRKLAIEINDATNLRLAVLLTPLRDGEQPTDAPAIVPLSQWALAGDSVPLLSKLTIDGEPVPGFAPNFLTYDIELPADRTDVPKVRAETRDRGTKVTVLPPESIPGTVNIELERHREPKIVYKIHLAQQGATQTVIASIQGTNPPEYTIDNNLATFFSAEGDGQWIQYYLGRSESVTGVALAWSQGDKRVYSFDVLVSTDAVNWTKAYSGSSAGNTLALEQHQFPAVLASYIRVVGHGNSANTWMSLCEFRALLGSATWPDPATIPVTLDKAILAMNPPTATMGQTAQLSMSGTMSDGTAADLSGASIRYYSSNEAVARVNAEGLVEFLSIGSADISGIATMSDRVVKHDRRVVAVADPNPPIDVIAAADSVVRAGASANSNYGALAILIVKKSVPDETRESYLAFDIANIGATEIESATVNFWARVEDTAGTEIDIQLHAVSSPWQETQITWNTKPPAGQRIGTCHIDNAWQWRSVDLTEYVRTELSQGRTMINMVMLQDLPDTNGLYVRIGSRETTTKPYLRIRSA